MYKILKHLSIDWPLYEFRYGLFNIEKGAEIKYQM